MSHASMQNPEFARRAWARLRAHRPMNRAGPGHKPRRPDQTAPPNTKGLAPIMIKLNAGVSRKVGEPNYGSRGATVNMELELESAAAQDVSLLHDRIRKLFAIARDAVQEELGLGAQHASPPSHPIPNGNGHGAAPANGNGSARPATPAQLRAIHAICTQWGLEAADECRQRLGTDLRDLTVAQASRLIDELKAAALPDPP